MNKEQGKLEFPNRVTLPKFLEGLEEGLGELKKGEKEPVSFSLSSLGHHIKKTEDFEQNLFNILASYNLGRKLLAAYEKAPEAEKQLYLNAVELAIVMLDEGFGKMISKRVNHTSNTLIPSQNYFAVETSVQEFQSKNSWFVSIARKAVYKQRNEDDTTLHGARNQVSHGNIVSIEDAKKIFDDRQIKNCIDMINTGLSAGKERSFY
jgi:hypothetical protein